MGSHKNITGTNMHVPHALEYADAAEREADTSLAETYVKKLALQLDDFSLWVLQDTTPTWVQVGGGGGGVDLDIVDPTGILHRLDTANAVDDEFDDGSISGDWTGVDGGTGTVVWTETRNALNALFYSNPGNKAYAKLKATTLADGEAFETLITGRTNALSQFPFTGLILTDGVLTSSNAFVACVFSNASVYDVPTIRGGTVSDLSISTFLDGINSVTPRGAVRLRLFRTDSTHYGIKLSGNGVDWVQFGSTYNPGFTPTHAGPMVTSWTSGEKHIASFEYFRKVTE